MEQGAVRGQSATGLFRKGFQQGSRRRPMAWCPRISR